MNAQEAKFNAWLRAHLEGDFMRVENTCCSGTPDINVCWQGREIWIESKIWLKAFHGPAIRPMQYAWGFKRARNGGTVWVLSLREETGIIQGWMHPFAVELVRDYLTPPLTADLTFHKSKFDQSFLFTDH